MGGDRASVKVLGLADQRVTLGVDLPTLAFIASQMKTHTPGDAVTSELLEAFADACGRYIDELLGSADHSGFTIKVTV